MTSNSEISHSQWIPVYHLGLNFHRRKDVTHRRTVELGPESRFPYSRKPKKLLMKLILLQVRSKTETNVKRPDTTERGVGTKGPDLHHHSTPVEVGTDGDTGYRSVPYDRTLSIPYQLSLLSYKSELTNWIKTTTTKFVTLIIVPFRKSVGSPETI